MIVIFAESGCVEWLLYWRRVVFKGVRVELIWVCKEFSQGYFDGNWFLLHLQMGNKSGLPCMTGRATHGYRGEWHWKWIHYCYCGNICVPVKLGTNTRWIEIRKCFWGEFTDRSQGDRLSRQQRGWNVSFETDRGGGISSYYPSIVFSEHFRVSIRCRILHLCP